MPTAIPSVHRRRCRQLAGAAGGCAGSADNGSATSTPTSVPWPAPTSTTWAPTVSPPPARRALFRLRRLRDLRRGAGRSTTNMPTAPWRCHLADASKYADLGANPGADNPLDANADANADACADANADTRAAALHPQCQRQCRDPPGVHAATVMPTFMPTPTPTFMPAHANVTPTSMPTSEPTSVPTSEPASAPASAPTSAPTHTRPCGASARTCPAGRYSDSTDWPRMYNSALDGDGVPYIGDMTACANCVQWAIARFRGSASCDVRVGRANKSEGSDSSSFCTKYEPGYYSKAPTNNSANAAGPVCEECDSTYPGSFAGQIGVHLANPVNSSVIEPTYRYRYRVLRPTDGICKYINDCTVRVRPRCAVRKISSTLLLSLGGLADCPYLFARMISPRGLGKHLHEISMRFEAGVRYFHRG